MQRFGDLSGLSPDEVSRRRIQVAQQVHAEFEERGALVLVGGNMDRALASWLGSPDVEIRSLVNSEQGKLRLLRSQRDTLIRQVVAPDSPESAARQRELRAFDAKIKELLAQPR